MVIRCLLVALIGLSAAAAFAQTHQAHKSPELDRASEQALRDTQNLLKDQKRLEREGLLTPEARQNHEKIKVLMGNEADTAEAYALAADIFGDLVKESGGNPALMLEMLNQLIAKPEAFANKLSPDQQRKLKELAKKVENRKKQDK
jgi:hypothetical protein